MPYDFVVVGATGMQGRIVSRHLLEEGYSVLLCGRDKQRVEHLLKKFSKAAFAYVELRQIRKTLQTLRKASPDIILNCAEGDFNLSLQKIALQLGAHYLDMGSEVEMTGRQFALNKAFKKKGKLALTGCGSVPGIGNIMLAYAKRRFDSVEKVDVGFAWAANMDVFVAPFSIQSIVEEFTDKPDIVENGKLKKTMPMAKLTEANISGIGKQHLFLVRHPELYTFREFLKPSGIKDINFYAGFPPHSFQQIMSFITLGFGSHDDILIDGKWVKPIYYLTEILKNVIIPENYREKENLWLTVEGKENGQKRLISMSCLVPTLSGWEDAGCNIDTGFPMAIIGKMIHSGTITATGSASPEFVIPPDQFFARLAKYKIEIYENDRKVF